MTKEKREELGAIIGIILLILLVPIILWLIWAPSWIALKALGTDVLFIAICLFITKD